MEDILILNYLKDKGYLNSDEYSNISYKINNPSSDEYEEFFDSLTAVTKNMSQIDKNKFIDSLKYYNKDNEKTVQHFNPDTSKVAVSKMSHKEDYQTIIGEIFPMSIANETHIRYNGLIPTCITDCDIYVAINDHYHRLACLYKIWFPTDYKNKIIESAMTYWFKNISNYDAETFMEFYD